MSCSHHQTVVRYWSSGGPDLPDTTALHLDDCPDCLAAFEERFTPTRRMPAARSSRPLPWLAVAAAALLLTLPSAEMSETSAPLDLSECIDEVLLPPVCEV